MARPTPPQSMSRRQYEAKLARLSLLEQQAYLLDGLLLFLDRLAEYPTDGVEDVEHERTDGATLNGLVWRVANEGSLPH